MFLKKYYLGGEPTDPRKIKSKIGQIQKLNIATQKYINNTNKNLFRINKRKRKNRYDL